MLNRVLLHLSLIILFAFTQIGATAHQISHLNDHQEEQDQTSHQEQCSQCITYNHIADVDIAHDFWLEATPIDYIFSNAVNALGYSQQTQFYDTRAPPYSLLV